MLKKVFLFFLHGVEYLFLRKTKQIKRNNDLNNICDHIMHPVSFKTCMVLVFKLNQSHNHTVLSSVVIISCHESLKTPQTAKLPEGSQKTVL